MTRPITWHLLLLFVGLILTGCANIEPELEFEGRLEELSSVEFQESGSSGDRYLPALPVTGGMIVAPTRDLLYGVYYLNEQGGRLRTFGQDAFGGFRFHAVRAMAASADGNLFAVGAVFQSYSSNGVMVYDIATGKRLTPVIEPPDGITADISSVAFSPGGDTIAIAYGQDVAIYGIGGSILYPPTLIQGEPFDDNYGLAFSPTDPDRLASTDGILSIAAGGTVVSFSNANRFYLALEYTPDGQHIVAGGRDGFHLIDAVTGEELGNIREVEEVEDGSGEFQQQPYGIFAVDVSADGSWAVTGGEEGIVTVWDIATGAVIARDTASAYIYLVRTSTSDPTTFQTSTLRHLTTWRISP